MSLAIRNGLESVGWHRASPENEIIELIRAVSAEPTNSEAVIQLNLLIHELDVREVYVFLERLAEGYSLEAIKDLVQNNFNLLSKKNIDKVSNGLLHFEFSAKNRHLQKKVEALKENVEHLTSTIERQGSFLPDKKIYKLFKENGLVKFKYGITLSCLGGMCHALAIKDGFSNNSILNIINFSFPRNYTEAKKCIRYTFFSSISNSATLNGGGYLHESINDDTFATCIHIASMAIGASFTRSYKDALEFGICTGLGHLLAKKLPKKMGPYKFMLIFGSSTIALGIIQQLAQMHNRSK